MDNYDEDYSDMPALGIATEENVNIAMKLLPNEVNLYKEPFWNEKYDKKLNLFFRTFKYEEEEIKDLIDDIKKTEFPEIKKFIDYLIKILNTKNDFCGVVFDNMEVILDCKYCDVWKFSSSTHEKVRYNFISKIERKKSSEILYTEENAAFFSDDEMPELEPI